MKGKIIFNVETVGNLWVNVRCTSYSVEKATIHIENLQHHLNTTEHKPCAVIISHCCISWWQIQPMLLRDILYCFCFCLQNGDTVILILTNCIFNCVKLRHVSDSFQPGRYLIFVKGSLSQDCFSCEVTVFVRMVQFFIALASNKP